MRYIYFLLILSLAVHTISTAKLKRNRKIRRQNGDVNTTAHPTVGEESTPKIENVTKNFVIEKSKRSSIDYEIKNLIGAIKASRNSSDKILTDLVLQDGRNTAEKTRIINIQVEKHSPKKIAIECKFGNVSDL